jgi:hypothetical protein
MRDETIGTESASPSNFDLDAFLIENNFLADEDAKNIEKDAKAKSEAKQTSKQSRRRATSKRPASDEDGADNPVSPDAVTDTSARDTAASAKAAGSTRSARSAKTPKGGEAAKVTRDTKSIESTEDKKGIEGTKDIENTGSIRRAKSTKSTRRTEDTESAKSTEKTEDTESTKKIDLNATMSYETLGVDYPEFPFVEGKTIQDTAKTASGSADKRDATSQTNAMPRKASSSRTPSTSSTSRTSSASRSSSGFDTDAPASETTQSVATAESASKTTTRRSRTATASTTRKSRSAAETTITDATTTTGRPAADTLRAHPSTATSSTTKKRSRSDTAARSTATPKRAPRLATLANPNDFHPAELVDNSYHIRGGGTRHNRRSPVMVILMALVIISGGGLLGFFLWDAFQGLLGEKPVENVITLSASETRGAIDSEMPVLLDYIWNGSESAQAVFLDNGWNVVMTGRDTSDNPDTTAVGSEIIHLAAGVDPSVLDNGYYASEFDGYDYDELQANFNGAWMLDISQGDLGVYAQLKYVNFAADSLDDEFQHLRELQRFAGDNLVTETEGVDGFGNSYVRGSLVIEEVTYYWEIIGIAFGNYYGGQDRRNLPETAVYVKCRIANFDFHGATGSSSEAA